MEPNRNVDRLKYLINDHSIINQEKLSLPVDKWEKNNLNRIPKCSTVLVLLTNLFYIKAEKKKKGGLHLFSLLNLSIYTDCCYYFPNHSIFHFMLNIIEFEILFIQFFLTVISQESEDIVWYSNYDLG